MLIAMEVQTGGLFQLILDSMNMCIYRTYIPSIYVPLQEAEIELGYIHAHLCIHHSIAEHLYTGRPATPMVPLGGAQRRSQLWAAAGVAWR